MYDGGSDVSGYVVEILEEGSEQWYRATTKPLKTNEYVAAGLAANKKYRFRVAALNNKGTGEFSDPSSEVEPLEKTGEQIPPIRIQTKRCRSQSALAAEAPSLIHQETDL